MRATSAFLSFEVPGVPQGKGRARAAVRAGLAAMYTPAKTRAYEKEIAWLGTAAMRGRPLIEGAVWVHVVAFFPIPARWPAAKRAQAARGGMAHVTRPDGDNAAKAALDGLNGVAWKDDCQVADLRVKKLYAAEPRMVISVGLIEESEAAS